MLNSRRRRDVATIVTDVAAGGIVAGVLSLCQPWSPALCGNGFPILPAGTVGYIVTSRLEQTQGAAPGVRPTKMRGGRFAYSCCWVASPSPASSALSGASVSAILPR